jgi:hypothetical protein
MYELKEMPDIKETAAFPSLDKFVTREEFERAFAELKAKPKEKIEPLTF